MAIMVNIRFSVASLQLEGQNTRQLYLLCPKSYAFHLPHGDSKSPEFYMDLRHFFAISQATNLIEIDL